MRHPGVLLLVTGPSGVGKRTLIEHLLRAVPTTRLVVSVTTRQPRKGEVNGVQYHFISPEEFRRMIQQDELLEYAEYVGNYYGTPKKNVEGILQSGHHAVLELEVEGAEQMRRKVPHAVSVFVMPPTPEIATLRERLAGRGTEDAERIERRLRRAQEEMERCREFAHVIVNDNPNEAGEALVRILLDAVSSSLAAAD